MVEELLDATHADFASRLELICAVALIDGHGVRVRQDGLRFHAQIDPIVPRGRIVYELSTPDAH